MAPRRRTRLAHLRQLNGGSCGTIAVLHALLNCPRARGEVQRATPQPIWWPRGGGGGPFAAAGRVALDTRRAPAVRLRLLRRDGRSGRSAGEALPHICAPAREWNGELAGSRRTEGRADKLRRDVASRLYARLCGPRLRDGKGGGPIGSGRRALVQPGRARRCVGLSIAFAGGLSEALSAALPLQKMTSSILDGL